MKKITKRTVFETLIKVAEGEDFTEYMTAEDLKAFAENEIALLDRKTAKAQERAAVKRAEGDALRAAVEAALTSDFQTVADIATQIEGEDVTVGKIQNRLSALTAMGVARKEKVTIDVDGKKKERMAYALADVE